MAFPKAVIKQAAFCLLVALLLTCANNNDDQSNYGPVDLSLLTSLTWYNIDNAKDPLSVGKFVSVNHPIYNYYYWKWFSCRDSACDTLFRDDTSSAITNVEIIQDTIRFSNAGWLGYTALITKLTDDELVLIFLENSPWFRHYRRNHRTLVTKGTGANTGIDSVEYHE